MSCLVFAVRSQGPDRVALDSIRRELAAAIDGTPSVAPVTPGSTIWLRKRRRFVIGEEYMSIQGIFGIDLKLTQAKLKELGGQAMCCASSIPVICAVHSNWE